MRFLLYEDEFATDLSPIALLRPVFELICGRESLRRRLGRWFPTAHWGVWLRSHLATVYREQNPDCHVNHLDWLQNHSTLLINGRWLPELRLDPAELNLDTAGFVDGHLAWIALAPDELSLLTEHDFITTLHLIARSRRAITASGRMVRYPWDLVSENSQQLIRDFRDEGFSQIPTAEQVVVLGDPVDVYVSEMAQLDPFVVLDARKGPISIDRDVQIQSFTRIEGPCHIGRGSRVFRALIHGGTTIGECCRVGGEIEESILHAFVNKYHEGFLGHSYVCPWVNLGAMTSTSDLKSDYSQIRIPLQGTPIDSNLMKAGSYIGDHTKTAIDSMFNTGSSIGVMTLVLPGGRLLPRHIPSFCNISFGELATDWPLENSLAAAAVAMSRRDQRLTAAMEQLIRTVYEQTEAERQAALDRALQRRVSM